MNEEVLSSHTFMVIKGVTERPNHPSGWAGKPWVLGDERSSTHERFGGEEMEDTSRFHDRRGSIRLKMIYPALYTRFDNQGRAYDQKISRSKDVSQGGVRLQSGFRVDSGEVLDITMALGETLVTFKGKVIYVTPSEDQSFELGISIEDIKNQDRVALTRFIDDSEGSGRRWDA